MIWVICFIISSILKSFGVKTSFTPKDFNFFSSEGGIIPPSDERKLKSFGVKQVFTPKDFKIEEIMKQITQIIKEAY